jgi:hypothetical protein
MNVDPDLAHRLHYDRVDLLAGLRARRPHPDPPLREVVRERGGHLRAAGVAHAHEEHLGLGLLDMTLGLRERPQALAGETTAQEPGEVHVAATALLMQLVTALVHEAVDGRARPDPVELLRQIVDGALEKALAVVADVLLAHHDPPDNRRVTAKSYPLTIINSIGICK